MDTYEAFLSRNPEFKKLDDIRKKVFKGSSVEDHYAVCRYCKKWIDKDPKDLNKVITCYSCANSSYREDSGEDPFGSLRG